MSELKLGINSKVIFCDEQFIIKGICFRKDLVNAELLREGADIEEVKPIKVHDIEVLESVDGYFIIDGTKKVKKIG